MFSKLSIKGFVCDLVDVFMFPNQETQEIYQKYQVDKCYLCQNLFKQKNMILFLINESKVLESMPRLNILKQSFAQMPMLYELNSNTKLVSSGWKTTK